MQKLEYGVIEDVISVPRKKLKSWPIFTETYCFSLSACAGLQYFLPSHCVESLCCGH